MNWFGSPGIPTQVLDGEAHASRNSSTVAARKPARARRGRAAADFGRDRPEWWSGAVSASVVRDTGDGV